MSLKVIKDGVEQLYDVRRDIYADSISELPSREALRAALCKLDFVIASLRGYVYDNAE